MHLFEGYIKIDVNGYYISTDFKEFENNVFTKETYQKYSQIDFLGFSDVKIDGYELKATGIVEGFKTTKGDIFKTQGLEIRMNDVIVYDSKPVINSGSSTKKTSGNKSCSYCGGTGKKLVKWYSEGDWGSTSYSSYKCTYCNGTGKK